MRPESPTIGDVSLESGADEERRRPRHRGPVRRLPAEGRPAGRERPHRAGPGHRHHRPEWRRQEHAPQGDPRHRSRSRAGPLRCSGVPRRPMRSRMAYVPQREIVDWDFPVTVWDVVMMGRYPRIGWLHRPGASGIPRSWRTCFVRSGCGRLAAPRSASCRAASSSACFVARALAQEADVLLLDEPFNGIDAQTQEVIRAIIESGRQSGQDRPARDA